MCPNTFYSVFFSLLCMQLRFSLNLLLFLTGINLSHEKQPYNRLQQQNATQFPIEKKITKLFCLYRNAAAFYMNSFNLTAEWAWYQIGIFKIKINSLETENFPIGFCQQPDHYAKVSCDVKIFFSFFLFFVFSFSLFFSSKEFSSLLINWGSENCQLLTEPIPLKNVKNSTNRHECSC